MRLELQSGRVEKWTPFPRRFYDYYDHSRGRGRARRIICRNLLYAPTAEIVGNCCFLDIDGKKDILKISSSTGI
jgi:hypothetical protein